MKSVRFQNLGTNKKVIIVHPQTRYWSPVERTLKLFLTFFPKEKIQTQETGRPFVHPITENVSPHEFSASDFFHFDQYGLVNLVQANAGQ
jgi:hypothetical protein